MSSHMKIRKDDMVLVIGGNDRGKRGKVGQLDLAERRVALYRVGRPPGEPL